MNYDAYTKDLIIGWLLIGSWGPCLAQDAYPVYFRRG